MTALLTSRMPRGFLRLYYVSDKMELMSENDEKRDDDLERVRQECREQRARFSEPIVIARILSTVAYNN